MFLVYSFMIAWIVDGVALCVQNVFSMYDFIVFFSSSCCLCRVILVSIGNYGLIWLKAWRLPVVVIPLRVL